MSSTAWAPPLPPANSSIVRSGAKGIGAPLAIVVAGPVQLISEVAVWVPPPAVAARNPAPMASVMVRFAATAAALVGIASAAVTAPVVRSRPCATDTRRCVPLTRGPLGISTRASRESYARTGAMGTKSRPGGGAVPGGGGRSGTWFGMGTTLGPLMSLSRRIWATVQLGWVGRHTSESSIPKGMVGPPLRMMLPVITRPSSVRAGDGPIRLPVFTRGVEISRCCHAVVCPGGLTIVLRRIVTSRLGMLAATPPVAVVPQAPWPSSRRQRAMSPSQLRYPKVTSIRWLRCPTRVATLSSIRMLRPPLTPKAAPSVSWMKLPASTRSSAS